MDQGNPAAAAGAGRGLNRLPPMHLQSYDGDPRRFREFRRTLHIVFAASPGMTEIEKLALVIGLLSGDAKGWWMSKPDTYQANGWTGLLQDMQAEMFGAARNALWSELQHRTLRAGESLNTYKYDIANLCEMLGFQGPEQVSCFIRGLPEHVRNSVAAQVPADLDAAFLIARHVMEFADPIPLKTAYSAPQFPSVFGEQKPWGGGRDRETDTGRGREDVSLTREIADLTQQLGQITLHLLKEKEGRGRENSQPNRFAPRTFGAGSQIICGKCLKAGHIQRNCTNPPDPTATRCNNCSFYGHKESECRKPPRPKPSKSHLLELVSGFGSQDVSETLKFDDGHEEGPSDESLPYSNFMGFTLESALVLPPCEMWCENDEVLSAPLCLDTEFGHERERKVRFNIGPAYESDAESESSFQVTSSESEDMSCSTQPEVINPVRRAKRTAQPQKKAQARSRQDVEDEERAGKREHRKELREEKRTSNYKVLEAMLGSKVPLMSEVGGKLPYFRKDVHDWVDHKVLNYVPKKRGSAKETAFSKLEPLSEPACESLGAWTYESTGHPAVTTSGQLRHILVRFGEVSVPAVIDTGSQISVLSYSFVRDMGLVGRLNEKEAPRFTGSDLQSHKARGTIALTMSLGKLRVKTVFTVVDGPSSSFRVLIGQDILGPTYASCCNEAMEVRFKAPDGTYVRCPFIRVSKNG
jgi:hypothetical protein